MRISKEEAFMRMAETCALRSTCKRLSVGVIITDSKMRNILSMGYNGNYVGGPNTCDSNEVGNCGCIHSEVNSLIKCNNSENMVMFTSESPCLSCSKLIINSNIKKVYYRNEYRLKEGIDLLRKMGVEVINI